MMRTNIFLNETLIKRAQSLTGLKTKKAVVEEALQVLIRLREQEELRSMRGKLLWEGDLNTLRQERFDHAG
jgi:Arc/MetJ family transcription regulator